MTNWMTRWGKRDAEPATTEPTHTPEPPPGTKFLGIVRGKPVFVSEDSLQTDEQNRTLNDMWIAGREGTAIARPDIPPTPLCAQIAEALDGIPVGSLKKSGVTVNTLVRAKSGEGIRLETLEKIARYLGWTITITDKEGNPIVRAS